MALIKAFSLPIMTHVWEDSQSLNRDLREVILEKEKMDEGMTRSNARSCWHSQTDLLNWDEPSIKDFHQRLKQFVPGFIQALGGDPAKYSSKANAWAMVSRDGDYGFPHTHPGCVASGVYYIDTGKPYKGKFNGALEFVNSKPFNMHVEGLVLNEKHVIDPKPGLGVMFRSDALHMVHPFYGKGERIAIAYNVSIARK